LIKNVLKKLQPNKMLRYAQVTRAPKLKLQSTRNQVLPPQTLADPKQQPKTLVQPKKLPTLNHRKRHRSAVSFLNPERPKHAVRILDQRLNAKSGEARFLVEWKSSNGSTTTSWERKGNKEAAEKIESFLQDANSSKKISYKANKKCVLRKAATAHVVRTSAIIPITQIPQKTPAKVAKAKSSVLGKQKVQKKSKEAYPVQATKPHTQIIYTEEKVSLPRVGDHVKCRFLVDELSGDKWMHGVVTSTDRQVSVRIHGFRKSHSFVEIQSSKELPQKHCLETYNLRCHRHFIDGELVEYNDRGLWRLARVIDQSNDMVLIRFEGFSKYHCKFAHKDSPNIRFLEKEAIKLKVVSHLKSVLELQDVQIQSLANREKLAESNAEHKSWEETCGDIQIAFENDEEWKSYFLKKQDEIQQIKRIFEEKMHNELVVFECARCEMREMISMIAANLRKSLLVKTHDASWYSDQKSLNIVEQYLKFPCHDIPEKNFVEMENFLRSLVCEPGFPFVELVRKEVEIQNYIWRQDLFQKSENREVVDLLA